MAATSSDISWCPLRKLSPDVLTGQLLPTHLQDDLIQRCYTAFCQRTADILTTRPDMKVHSEETLNTESDYYAQVVLSSRDGESCDESGRAWQEEGRKQATTVTSGSIKSFRFHALICIFPHIFP